MLGIPSGNAKVQIGPELAIAVRCERMTGNPDVCDRPVSGFADNSGISDDTGVTREQPPKKV